MAKYKIPQNEIDALTKQRILSIIWYYTIKDGHLDTVNVNPETLKYRFGVELDTIKNLVQELVSEGKIKKIT